MNTPTRWMLVPIACAALAGCAAMQVDHEYGVANATPARVTTIVEGSSKSWNVYSYPTDRTRILVTESTGTSYAKALNPIGAFADLTAASGYFDQAVETYLRKSNRNCEIARSNEISDLNAYEYHLRCVPLK